MKIEKVSEIVLELLRKDPKTRDSDRYLYSEVVREIKPSALYQPFFISIMDEDLPSTETVRRTRQKAQADYPELAASAQVEGFRDYNENLFFNYAVKGT